MRLRIAASLLMLVAAAAFFAAAALPGSHFTPRGGTFRIGHADEGPLAVDPALGAIFGEIGSLVCLYPLNYADSTRVGLVPEAAVRFPSVSRDGKTYTFRIRKGLRLSTRERVTPQTFAAAINRTLRAGHGPAFFMEDIAGSDEVLEGKAQTASGVRVSGGDLIVTLKAPAPDFVLKTVTVGYCAVPIGLPSDPEGVGAPIPSGGPYYVASWVRGRRLVVKRNRLYRGPRPHHVAGFVFSYGLDPETIVLRIERGSLDTGDVPAGAYARLARRYRVNRTQFYAKPTAVVYHMRLNIKRGLFRQPRARRAVNFAVNRTALVRAGERVTENPRFGFRWGTATDQWLPPGMPGYRHATIYPSRGNARKARSLFGRRARRSELAIYTRNFEPFLSSAQLVAQDLRRAGIRSKIKAFPVGALDELLDKPGEPWDLALNGAYGADYPDAASQLALFGSENTDIPLRYRQMYDRAQRSHGRARYRLFGKLDVLLQRNLALTVPYAILNLRTLVSKRVGCKVFHPELDLAAVCLRR